MRSKVYSTVKVYGSVYYVLFLWRYNFDSLCSFKFDMKIYSYNNTCLLSVYGGPTWDMLCGTKDSEERDKFLWCYKHVIVCCSIKENPKHRIVPAPVKMEPGSAYLVFTIGGFKARANENGHTERETGRERVRE